MPWVIFLGDPTVFPPLTPLRAHPDAASLLGTFYACFLGCTLLRFGPSLPLMEVELAQLNQALMCGEVWTRGKGP
ncbi:conserved hypothetical protein [Ricinus communis]|uniref:Uncharacterized protein n=1 Tax=Ricinus communis TaxID=3988 RepID=B9SIS2_RICCO|nr:conserved hypothetical protein [Ricinus communis]